MLKAHATAELRAARRAHRHPGRHHADGARRVPGQPRAAPRACPACTARSPRSPRCRRPTCSIALGTRFDDRVTGKLDTFAPDATIIHADIDPAEIGKNRIADVPIVGDVREVHRRPDRRRPGRVRRRQPRPISPAWWRQLDALARRPIRSATTSRPTARLAPQYVIERLGKIAGPDDDLRRRASASTRCGRRSSSATRTPYTWLNSGGAGTMGYAVPAAMGAKVGRPDTLVWAIDGDGCFQMTNQELATCAIEGIPIKVARHQQRQPRHGAAVADAVLRRALQPDRTAVRTSAAVPRTS